MNIIIISTGIRWYQKRNFHTRRPEQYGRQRRRGRPKMGQIRPTGMFCRPKDSTAHKEPHKDPLHKDIDNGKPCGVGPGMPFSNMLLKKDPDVGVIGLVPCAVGGTSISQWQRGGFLYDQLLKRANAALQDGGPIRAMLWYQGESDSNDTMSAETYGNSLKQFFCDLRLDLASPLLPIVQVAVTSRAGRYVDIVRKAQLEMDLPNIFCIDADGLEVNRNDELHLTTSAQVQLGRMFADVILYCTMNFNKDFCAPYMTTK
ncbi:hypothetical protein OROGR_008292 [Orobanche gracilis]